MKIWSVIHLSPPPPPPRGFRYSIVPSNAVALLNIVQLGDNCIQNFHLGRYIVVYTVGNLVLQRRVSGAIKRDFRTYIRRYTSPNENFEYGYPHSNVLLTFSLQKDSEIVLCCAYTPSGCRLPAAYIHLSTYEK